MRLLPGGFSSSEGSTVGPMVLSLALFNNLVLTMSSQIGKSLAKRRTLKLESLHYYVLTTMFPLLGHLDDQCSEFLESWMAYLEFDEFPDESRATLQLEMVHYLRKSTLQSKKVHYLSISSTYIPYPIIFLRQHTQPNPTHNEYTTIVVKKILHYYWSTSYPI